MEVGTSIILEYDNSYKTSYIDLNELEKEFAHALDKTKKVWCRNPSQGGYEIPLLDRGNTRTFNPDFLVWTDAKHVVAIDTKGDQLIVEAVGRKLFRIEVVAPGQKVSIRLVTAGHWGVANGCGLVIGSHPVFSFVEMKLALSQEEESQLHFMEDR